jgi:hypothetical protein
MRGRSILKGKIGEEIANPTLSIIDNPLLEKGMLTSKCDDEGSASQKTELVKDGVLNSFIYDIYTANCEGVKTTSNGLRGSYLTTPMISPSNLEFEFSERKDMSEIRSGVLTTSVLGAHTANPISGDFSVEASNAFKIENGELDKNNARIGGLVNAGRVLVDGLGVGDVGNIVIRDRQMLSENGMILVVFSLDSKTARLVGGPDIITRGFVYVRESEDLMEEIREFSKNQILRLEEEGVKEWSTIKSKVRDSLCDFVYKKTRRNPMILPIITEVDLKED